MKIKPAPKGLRDIKYAGQVREGLSPFYGKQQTTQPVVVEAVEEPKGRFNGRCNVTACQRPRSKIFMPIENAYYCVACARKMIEWDLYLKMRGEQDWLRFPDGLVEDTENRQR